MQRHHLIPRVLLGSPGLNRFFTAIDPRKIGFEDFRRNGLLLPCEERLAARTGLPLQRGPHRSYDDMVAQRIGEIERRWSERRRNKPKLSGIEARLSLSLLQRALRRELLSHSPPQLALPRDTEIGRQMDFAELDKMADQLWSASQPAAKVPNLARSASLAA